MKIINRIFVLVILFTLSLYSTSIHAGAGDLDLSFGVDGKVITDIGYEYGRGYFTGSDLPQASDRPYFQSDGKFIVPIGLGYQRFNADGTLDASFGNKGYLIPDRYDSPEATWYYNYVAPLDNEHMLVAGRLLKRTSAGTDNDFLLVRHKSDGSIDTSFGQNGSIILDFQDRYGGVTQDILRYVFINNDDSITGIGTIDTGSEYHHVMIRFTGSGALDHSYGNDGILEIDLGSNFSYYDVLRQYDGKYLVSIRVGSTWKLLRLTSDGLPDSTFGVNGLITPLVSTTYTIQPDGKIIVGGYASDYPDPICGFGLYRYNTDGSQDFDFGSNGRVLTDFGCSLYPNVPRISSRVRRVSFKPDGKIIALGELSTWFGPDNYYYDLALAQYNPDGTLDTSFGNDGKIVTELPGRDTYPYAVNAYSIISSSDGKVLALGNLENHPYDPVYYSYNNPVIIRYTQDGTLDTSFADNGIFFVPVSWKTNDEAEDIVSVQMDGKLIVGGFSDQGFSRDFALVRYLPDGRVDMTFGDQGRVVTDFSRMHTQVPGCYLRTNEQISSIETQQDGKIIAIGYSDFRYISCNPDSESVSLAMARYNVDGSLDESFGDAGLVLIGPTNGQPSDIGYYDDIAVQLDGKIVVVGETIGSQRAYTAFRFNTDGSLDQSFGIGGVAVFDLFTINSIEHWEELRSVAIQSDGKILVAGRFFVTGPSGIGYEYLNRWNVFRLNDNGSIDNSFNPAGNGILNVFSYGQLGKMVLQPDGRILLVGYGARRESDLTFTHFLAARFNSDGSPDPGFGSDGVLYTDESFGLLNMFGFESFTANSAALQADGRFVVLGTATEYWSEPDGSHGRNQDFALMRFDENGDYDYSFGEAGRSIVTFGYTDDEAKAVTIQSDGKILAVGNTLNSYNRGEIVIARIEGISTKVDELEGLVKRVQGLGASGQLNDGQGNSLQKKLQAAIQQVDRDNYATSVNQLGAFINQVIAFKEAAVLTEAQANDLTEEAYRIINILNN